MISISFQLFSAIKILFTISIAQNIIGEKWNFAFPVRISWWLPQFSLIDVKKKKKICIWWSLTQCTVQFSRRSYFSPLCACRLSRNWFAVGMQSNKRSRKKRNGERPIEHFVTNLLYTVGRCSPLCRSEKTNKRTNNNKNKYGRSWWKPTSFIFHLFRILKIVWAFGATQVPSRRLPIFACTEYSTRHAVSYDSIFHANRGWITDFQITHVPYVKLMALLSLLAACIKVK